MRTGERDPLGGQSVGLVEPARHHGDDRSDGALVEPGTRILRRRGDGVDTATQQLPLAELRFEELARRAVLDPVEHLADRFGRGDGVVAPGAEFQRQTLRRPGQGRRIGRGVDRSLEVGGRERIADRRAGRPAEDERLVVAVVGQRGQELDHQPVIQQVEAALGRGEQLALVHGGTRCDAHDRGSQDRVGVGGQRGPHLGGLTHASRPAGRRGRLPERLADQRMRELDHVVVHPHHVHGLELFEHRRVDRVTRQRAAGGDQLCGVTQLAVETVDAARDQVA